MDRCVVVRFLIGFGEFCSIHCELMSPNPKHQLFLLVDERLCCMVTAWLRQLLTVEFGPLRVRLKDRRPKDCLAEEVLNQNSPVEHLKWTDGALCTVNSHCCSMLKQ